MSKQWTPEQLGAINKSIEHWEQNKITVGEMRLFNNSNENHVWYDGLGLVAHYSAAHCDLCRFSNEQAKDIPFAIISCEFCPLGICNMHCSRPNGSWERCYNSVTQAEALTAIDAMIKDLKSLLEDK